MARSGTINTGPHAITPNNNLIPNSNLNASSIKDDGWLSYPNHTPLMHKHEHLPTQYTLLFLLFVLRRHRRTKSHLELQFRVSSSVRILNRILWNSKGLLFLTFGEPCLAHLIFRMKVTVVSRSGREVIKGGLELSDSVCLLHIFCLVFIISMFGW
jgi:hypothetical protein